MSIGSRTFLTVLCCALLRPGSALSQNQPDATDPISRLPAVTSPPPRGTPTAVAQDDGRGQEVNSLVERLQIETLDQAWHQAIAVDQQLMAHTANLDSAARALDASTAERYPTAGLSGQYTLRDNEPAFRITTPLLPYTFKNPYLQTEDFAFEGRVNMPLYTGGRVTHGIEAAASTVQAYKCRLARGRLDLKMRVAEVYVAVLRAEQEVVVAESHERSLSAHARDIEMLYRQERAPRNDLLAAQVALSDAQHQVIKTQSQLDASRAAYNRRLGRPLVMPVQLAALRVADTTWDVTQLTDQALAARPELKELDAQRCAHQHQAQGAAAENRAQVHLQGAYTYRENQYQSPQGITSAGVGVWWNLYDGGRARNEAAQQEQRARALAHARADLRSLIELEVRRAWLTVKETRQRLSVTQQSIRRSEENLRVTRQRYATGMATNTDVLAAESLRVQTYRNHNSAIYDAALADLRLHRATGTL